MQCAFFSILSPSSLFVQCSLPSSRLSQFSPASFRFLGASTPRLSLTTAAYRTLVPFVASESRLRSLPTERDDAATELRRTSSNSSRCRPVEGLLSPPLTWSSVRESGKNNVSRCSEDAEEKKARTVVALRRFGEYYDQRPAPVRRDVDETSFPGDPPVEGRLQTRREDEETEEEKRAKGSSRRRAVMVHDVEA